ncbi:MAG: glycosyltransferase family 4 protein [Phycisphaerae bacterium]|nr:glycosyltransferase family 4 protein [Phycisphaerae bacterium]
MAESSHLDSCEKPSICFVAHFAYGELAGVDLGHVGGIEHQQASMARWLARDGYRVSMITWDEGQPEAACIDGVVVHKLCRRDAGIRGPRFVHPRWTSLNRAMRRAEADIYYYNCGDMGLGQIVMWCRRHGRRSVYSVANDPDCDPSLPVLKPLRERILYRHGLHRVDRIVTQTRSQHDMLREGFGLESAIIPMPSEGIDESAYVAPAAPTPETARVLWVGRVSEQKRPELLLDLAERCPELSFDVVGASNTGTEYDQGIMCRADRLSNVTIHGRVPRSEMSAFYRRASVLCCTSAYEGFPNTFLEAWSHGIPSVTTFDPDHLVAERGLGWVARDVDELIGMLRESIGSADAWSAASSNARRYYLENHTMQACMPQFERMFQELASRS